MNIKDVNSAIMFNTWTDMELASMADAIKFARTKLQKTNIRNIMVGDTVKWFSQKRGINGQGVVTKVAIKYVTVREGATLWKVPANMLSVVDEATV